MQGAGERPEGCDVVVRLSAAELAMVEAVESE